jgi:hypothetical protein
MALFFTQTYAAEACFVRFTASGVTSIYHRYITTRAYSDATLCKNCKAIGEELSEILRFCTNRQLHFYLYRFAECEAVNYSVDKLPPHKEQTNKAEPANVMFSSAAARWHFAEMQKRSIGVSRNKYE